MNGRRFDTLATAFARRTSRRSAVRGAAAGLAALLGAHAGFRGARAQGATPVDQSDETAIRPSFLFVQTATSGGFSLNPLAGTPVVDGEKTVGGGATHLLTLEGHNGNTIYFSDRPNRIFGDWPTQQFLDELGFTPEFPPNAALITQADDDPEDEAIILELIEPTFNEPTGTLTYGATVLGAYAGEPITRIVADQAAGTLPETFGRASLFIDSLDSFYCDITICLFPSGALEFPIPGGPYNGYYHSLGDRQLGICRALPETEYHLNLNQICTEDPHCLPGNCTYG